MRLTESALDIWWLLSGVLGAAIIGLFLLGLLVPTIRSGRAIVVLAICTGVIAWIALSTGPYWPVSLAAFTSPFHPWLIVVRGPSVMVLTGWLMMRLKSD